MAKRIPRPSNIPGAKENDLHNLRHSFAHVLAAAVLELFPEAKFGVGPVIENGFYYDFQLPRPLTPGDLPKIEKRMKQIIAKKFDFKRQELSFAEAKAFFENKKQQFKVELIGDLEKKGTTYAGEGEETQADEETNKALAAGKVTIYSIGQFDDLCRGGHVQNTGELNAEAFRLHKISGAYWRGDQKNAQLQRVYGFAFATKQELDEHIKLLEEAAKRDHRKLGKDLDLFSFHDIAPGAPFWHPNGMIIVRELERFWREMHDETGYLETSTPIMNNAELYKTSGHWEHFRQNMFTLKVDEQDFALKPMNCPSATKIYASHLRSYRDLPLRLSEIGRLHRNEIRGALGGLLRVRQITMDDAHIFCRPDQMEKEIAGVFVLVKKFYKTFKLSPRFVLSTRPEKFLGQKEQWDSAEQSLMSFLKKSKVDFTVMAGEGAFYGPKIDIYITDSLKRDWQLATIQLDFQMPERFCLEYTDRGGDQKRPVMIHRAIFGSFERFLGILLEHTAGNLPVWLSPVQVQLIPVGSRHEKHCAKLHKEFQVAGIRTAVDDANETVGNKIRKASLQKIPYVLVIGDKEAKAAKLSVRIRGSERLLAITKKRFVERVKEELTKRT